MTQFYLNQIWWKTCFGVIPWHHFEKIFITTCNQHPISITITEIVILTTYVTASNENVKMTPFTFQLCLQDISKQQLSPVAGPCSMGLQGMVYGSSTTTVAKVTSLWQPRLGKWNKAIGYSRITQDRQCHGNAFHITDLLWRETTGHWRIWCQPCCFSVNNILNVSLAPGWYGHNQTGQLIEAKWRIFASVI